MTDTGMRIAPACLPPVFERFRQADGSTTREHGGLGLGLAIVKEPTELHSGTVQATTVRITVQFSSSPCLRAGFEPHVAKPFDAAQLVGVIAETLHDRHCVDAVWGGGAVNV